MTPLGLFFWVLLCRHSHPPRRSPAHPATATTRAPVTLNGREVYLGLHGSPESRREYDRLIGEWLASGRQTTSRSGGDLSVIELVAAFWKHAQTHYRKPDGQPTSETKSYKDVLRTLKRLYGETAVADFGPLALRALWDEMIRIGWCRIYINRQVHRVRHVFGWGVGVQTVHESVHTALMRVEPLEEGRTEARESAAVKPVPDERVEAVLPHLSAQVSAVVQLQWLTGARPDEILRMRTCEVDTSAETWVYRPATHKNAHRGHPREIPLGPKARAVLEPLLKRDEPEAFVFSPADAMRAHREARRAARKTPLSCGTVAGDNVKPERKRGPGSRYSVESYCKRIHVACEEAFPPPEHLARRRVPARGRKTKASRWETLPEWYAWLGEKGRAELARWRLDHRFSPHKLRHSAATPLRRDFGLEVSQCMLGHSTLTATQIYAKKNLEAARRVAAVAG